MNTIEQIFARPRWFPVSALFYCPGQMFSVNCRLVPKLQPSEVNMSRLGFGMINVVLQGFILLVLIVGAYLTEKFNTTKTR